MIVYAVVPTFNERDTIGAVVDGILAHAGTDVYVLVVDDDSPDGTGQLVAEMAASRPRVQLLRRTVPRGRGAACRDAYRECLRRGADIVVEMDADRPLPRCARHPRVRGATRRWLTRVANAYTRVLLGLAIRDGTTGFRVFRRRTLETLEPESLTSTGPALIEEMLFEADRCGLRIREVPITFHDRGGGRSKLGLADLARVFVAVFRLRWRARRRR